MKTVFYEIKEERTLQDKKWGEQNHPPYKWMAILGEEYGETCKAALEGNIEGYRAELIQAAAVCVAAIESLDRDIKRRGRNYGGCK